ncbi:hypothetical protein BHM03_00002291 [Ensete ventricosum]|nr:hypothetical protein BHM03_00002291 [Ensete ventricosum]
MADSWPLQLLTFILSFMLWGYSVVMSDDGRVLLQFRATLSSGGGDAALSSWAGGKGPCMDQNVSAWTGVYCENMNVSTLQLENLNFSGKLDLDILTGLPGLRSLSFRNNSFEGPVPDFTKLPALKSIYLSMNRFSGEIPDGMFSAMRALKKVWLSHNNLSGRIPSSLTVPAKLMEVGLDGNQFEGQLPDLRQPELRIVNVSYNNLEGPIPERLSNMSANLFEGNKNLCGAPVGVSCTPSKKLEPALLVGIVLIAVKVLTLLIGMVGFLLRRRATKGETTTDKLQPSKSKRIEDLEAASVEKGSADHDGEKKKVPKKEQGKLTFIAEGRKKFDMQDLLKASAEVLGSGNFGSSYKATLVDAPAVVVKRFKEMNGVGREDFQEHMRRLGRLSHPNLLPLVAYYYRKEEKLLITDTTMNWLATPRPGNRGLTESPLDWPTRLKIVKGVARGLAYLYEELPMLTVPHGHLKSSNVLLDPSLEPLLADYALVPVMNKTTASKVMVAYKSPECARYGKPSKKSDVWCFGILILEILTGEFPANHLTQGKAGAGDLASWVNRIASEERASPVFDKNMKGTENNEGAMLKLLQIAMSCCETDDDNRWELMTVLEKIEEIKGE